MSAIIIVVPLGVAPIHLQKTHLWWLRVISWFSGLTSAPYTLTLMARSEITRFRFFMLQLPQYIFGIFYPVVRRPMLCSYMFIYISIRKYAFLFNLIWWSLCFILWILALSRVWAFRIWLFRIIGFAFWIIGISENPKMWTIPQSWS